MPWQHFQNLSVPLSPSANIKRRYSITADVLAYQQCPKQYEMFSIRKYEPALAVQLFYGTIIHQVLDKAHAHYRGLIGPQTPNSLPTNTDIESYFLDVENALRARRIRAVSQVRDLALELLQRFNSIEGPVLYPRILDTECKLQADQGNYILHGNVDVIASVGGPTAGVEIWDYKGANIPSMGDPLYSQYVYQMQVYAELYRIRTGQIPSRAILYFLNELSGPTVPQQRPVNALLEVPLDSNSTNIAMQSFGTTVQEIEQCRGTGYWPNPRIAPSERNCAACDRRWNCSAARDFGRTYPLLYP